MSRFGPLPDLARLSDAEKDELILRLWRLVGGEDPANAPAAGGGEAAAGGAAGAAGVAGAGGRFTATGAARPARGLFDRLGADSGRRARTPVAATGRLGRGLGLWRSKAAIATVLLVGAAFAVDAGVGWWQARVLEAQRRAELQLENAAFGGLYVELVRVEYEPDGRSYRLTVTMQNTGDGPLYVMLSPMRVFEQSGLVWQEVPSRPADGQGAGVVALTGGREYQAVFEPNVDDWAELIPGYMHIRVESDMLISQRAEPTDDIVERKNLFYVYLKPHGADDEDIKRRSNYKSTPPVFIPMPPH